MARLVLEKRHGPRVRRGVDDYGESWTGRTRGLFESDELDVLAGDDVAGGVSLGAVGGVVAVESGCGSSSRRVWSYGWAHAAEAVGLDVAAEREFHWAFRSFLISYHFGCKSHGMEFSPKPQQDMRYKSKYWQPWDLRLEILPVKPLTWLWLL